MSSVVKFAAVGLVTTFMIFGVLCARCPTVRRVRGPVKSAGKCCGLRHNENVQSLVGRGKLTPTTTLNKCRRISGDDACEDHYALRCRARAGNDPGVRGFSGSPGS